MALTADTMAKFADHMMKCRSFPLACAYLMMIFLASIWERHMRPLMLREVMIIYNFTCSALSAYTLYLFWTEVYANDGWYVMHAWHSLRYPFYLYWITKNLELLDTVFMVLRNRWRQISFLHVYHHVTMLLLSDLAYHRYTWPAIAVVLGLNSFVHVLLYCYYGVTVLHGRVDVGWKRALTQLQILQFVVGMMFGGWGYLHHGFCVYSALYGLTMMLLFSNYYRHAYM